MAGCRMCGGGEDGLGLSALWSILTCSSRDVGGADAAGGGTNDGINYARISKRYDVVFEDRGPSFGGAEGAGESSLRPMAAPLTKEALSWSVLPEASRSDMIDKFIGKIEKHPPRGSSGVDVLTAEERSRMKAALQAWQAAHASNVSLRDLFNLYVVMDRVFKPVFEDKMTSLAGWTDRAPPRWKGETLTIHELLSDLWAGHVLLYGELTPNHSNVAPVLYDLIHYFGAVDEVGEGGAPEGPPAAASGAGASPRGAGAVASAASSESGATSSTGATMSRPPARFRWTDDFHLVYRTIVWLLREQVTPWEERTSDSWHDAGVEGTVRSSKSKPSDA